MTLREQLERDEVERLAAYAARSSCFGRRQSIEEHPWRTRFQRDRDRIIHAKAFRRLEAKAHWYIRGGGDHVRTQLTHSLEVAQIARTLARTLKVNEDLVEAVALAHDLGRTPFGGAFAAALSEQLRQLGLPPYSHEAQGLRVVDDLEERYARYHGLNLTSAVREGIVRHHAPRANQAKVVTEDKPGWPAEFAPRNQPASTVEGQVVALADSLAMIEQAFDDALRLDLYSYQDFTKGELFASLDRFFTDHRHLNVAAHLESEAGSSDEARRGVIVRCLVDFLVSDAIATCRELLAGFGGRAGEITSWCVGISAPVEQQATALVDTLTLRRNKDRRATLAGEHAATVARELFRAFLGDPTLLPPGYSAEAERAADVPGRAAVVTDYLAGMTDGYAQQEFDLVIMTSANVRARITRRSSQDRGEQ